MPHLCYKALLQPETQTEKLSRQILAWAGSHTTPFRCRQAMFKQVHHRPLKPLDCWTVLVSTTARQLRKFLDAWAGASSSASQGTSLPPITHHQNLVQRGQKQKIAPDRIRQVPRGQGHSGLVLHSASSSGKP